MASAADRLFSSRHVDPNAVSVPVGFQVEVVAEGLNNPSCLEFDVTNNIYIGEMGSPMGSAYAPGRVVRIRPDGSSETMAEGFDGSITGMEFREGDLYIVEHSVSGRVYLIAEDGSKQVLYDHLPGGGDHPTSDIVLAHSELLYFAQGTRTNSGVVGLDNAAWIRKHPNLHDIPGSETALTGMNFVSPNLSGDETVWTGAFQAFGVGDYEGENTPGSPLCSGAVMRADPDGGFLERFAWGFRNPVGLTVHQDGRVFCTDNGMENRGSRPIANGAAYLWQVFEGEWYGWPDFEGGLPVTDEQFRPDNALQPEFIMRTHPVMDIKPVATFPSGCMIAKFDFSRSPFFGIPDVAFIALMGGLDEESMDSGAGFKVVKTNIRDGSTEDFATNHHTGPASRYHSGGLERPIAVKFDRTGEIMYVLDMGIITDSGSGFTQTLPNTGVLWRIRTDEISA